jgi:hypothetical protein
VCRDRQNAVSASSESMIGQMNNIQSITPSPERLINAKRGLAMHVVHYSGNLQAPYHFVIKRNMQSARRLPCP